jgi:acyl-coenzyme A synthetase/AMP-(fatty) acid ligase
LTELKTQEQTTYGELRERVADLSTQFYIRNWQQGQVIALFMPLGLPYYITRLAAAQLGITVTIGTFFRFFARSLLSFLTVF